MKKLLLSIVGIASLLMVVSCDSSKNDISFQGIVLGKKFPNSFVKNNSYSMYSSIGNPTYFDSKSTILLPDSIEKKIGISVAASEENNRVFEIRVYLSSSRNDEETQLLDEAQQLYQMLLAKYGQNVASYTGEPSLSIKSQYYSARNYLYYKNPTKLKKNGSVEIPLVTWYPKPNTFIHLVAIFWPRYNRYEDYGSYPNPDFGILYIDESLKEEALLYSERKEEEHKITSAEKEINNFREKNTNVLNQDF